MTRVPTSCALTLATALVLFCLNPARAVVVATEITSKGEPVPEATVRLETVDGELIKLTEVRPNPDDNKDHGMPKEVAAVPIASPEHELEKQKASSKAEANSETTKLIDQSKLRMRDEDRPAAHRDSANTNDKPEDQTHRADAAISLLTDVSGKLTFKIDDKYKDKTVLIVVEKDGQILMKKTTQVTGSKTSVSIGVPPERLAKLRSGSGARLLHGSANEQTASKRSAADAPGTEIPLGKKEASIGATGTNTANAIAHVSHADLAVSLNRGGECRRGGSCCYGVRITNLGPGSWNGPISIEDKASFSPEGITLKQKQSNWTCAVAGRNITCTSVALTLAKGQSDTHRQCVELPRNPSRSVRNCVRILWPGRVDPDAAGRNVVRLVQLSLAQNGHDAGRADGMLGHRTMQAISEFRSKNGLSPDGDIDENLLVTLLGPATGDGNLANDASCDEFTLPPERTKAVEPSRRRRQRVSEDEPPPERGPDIGPLIELGIGIGAQQLLRQHHGRRHYDRDFHNRQEAE